MKMNGEQEIGEKKAYPVSPWPHVVYILFFPSSLLRIEFQLMSYICNKILEVLCPKINNENKY
jgi:hypothetical protein